MSGCPGEAPWEKAYPVQLRILRNGLERDGHSAFGFGIAEILEAVDRAGSIKQATGDLGTSYRYVRGRFKDDEEEAFTQQLVETQPEDFAKSLWS